MEDEDDEEEKEYMTRLRTKTFHIENIKKDVKAKERFEKIKSE